MGQEINCVALRHCSRRSQLSFLIFVTVYAAGVLQFVHEAKAQCAARDVLHNEFLVKESRLVDAPKLLVKSAADVLAWKRITLGTFTDSFAVRNALDNAGCSVGELASEILARPSFVIGSAKTSVELVAVSAAELGFKTDTVTLAALYARAQQLGFGLAAAEVGPQLRLQYYDQPVGEFLTIAMEPIKTWSGKPVILSVANGGAGLVLMGQEVRIDADVSTTSRFVFVRSKGVVPGDGSAQAVLLRPGTARAWSAHATPPR